MSLPLGGFKLELGGTLPRIDVAYETCGRVSPARDNVVFVCHALTGDAHVAGLRPGETEPSGWWEGMVGSGRAIDTDRYQVVCANVLGGCKGTTGPSSVNPATGKPYGSSFPRFTLGDTVEVYRLLLRDIGVTHLSAVIGGSFGGMQTLEWAFAHPGEVDRAVVIASATALNTQALAFDIVGRHAIVDDPDWLQGDYYGKDGPVSGLANARQLAHITYLSQELMDDKFGRAKQESWLAKGPEFSAAQARNFGTLFRIESYLDHQAEKFIARFDANSYLGITYAMDQYDATERYGSIDAACARATSRFLLVSLSGDWLFAPEQSREIVSALLRQKKSVSYCHLDVRAGHDGFLTHLKDLTRVVGAFLTPRPPVIRSWQRRHYEPIVRMVPNGAHVLDIGCGPGTLLDILRREKGATGNGIEISVHQIISGLAAGGDILYEDADEQLALIPEHSYGIAILSETLQVFRRPRVLLKHILRIADEAVVAFPNFAALSVRLQLAFRGRMPVGKQLPFAWYNTPNIHLCTLKDFRALCHRDGIEIREERAESRSLFGRILIAIGLPNLGAERVIVRLGRKASAS